MHVVLIVCCCMYMLSVLIAMCCMHVVLIVCCCVVCVVCIYSCCCTYVCTGKEERLWPIVRLIIIIIIIIINALPDMMGHKASMCTFCKPGENAWAKLCYDKYYCRLRGGVCRFDWNHFLGC